MVSGTYDCQLVFVAKLAAVLNASGPGTAPKCCGFNGSEPWARWRTYVTMTPIALNTSIATVYWTQVCSLGCLSPHSRSSPRSIRPSVRGSGCLSPSNTRNMNMPTGLVIARTTTKKMMICSQPLNVIRSAPA